MRLITFQRDEGGEGLGAVKGDLVFDLDECGDLPELIEAQQQEGKVRAACQMTRLLAMGPEEMNQVRLALDDFSTRFREPHPPFARALGDLRLLAPVPWPNKLLLLAGNYADHVKEGGGEAPEKTTTTPRVFMKPPTTTVIAPEQPVILPSNGEFIDYELEIAVVMGGYARFVTPEEAAPLIAGYTIVNDISERKMRIDAGRAPREGDRWFDWLNGKWYDTFAPMGPCLTTADEIGDVTRLNMELRVNGEVRQTSTPGHMVFNPAELVSWASRICTLEPGDVISTGTPAGVGSASGVRLKDGDVLEAEIECIGVLRNPVKAQA